MVFPLEGVRVVELGSMVGVPYAGKLLAEIGADVIKVEPPGAGDPARAFGPFPGHVPDTEASALFLYMNTAKRSMTLDVGTIEGRAILDRLLGTADVLLHDLTAEGARRAALDAETLEARFPRLLPAAITPFGHTGPYAELPGTDVTIQALSGYMGVTGNPGEQPLMAYGFQSQYSGALAVVVGVLAMLEGRAQWGEVDYLDVSMMDVMGATLEGVIAQFSAHGIDTHRNGNRLEHTGPFIDVFPTADGFVSITVTTVPQWEGLCFAMGRPEWIDDPALETWELRAANAELDHAIHEWFRGMTTQAAMEVLQELRVPSAPLLNCEELLVDPQALARSTFVEIDHPRTGVLRYPERTMLADGLDERFERAPLLGEHTFEVLAELGVPAIEFEHLRALGVV